MTLETYVAGLLVGGLPSHCRLCLLSSTEHTLGDATIYSEVLQRILSFKKSPVPFTARLCAACRALLHRCARILDALVQSHKLAVIAEKKPPKRNNVGNIVIAENDLVEGYWETRRLRDSACKLCITETLAIDSQKSGPPTAEPPSLATPTTANLAGIGNNIILVPAYGNQVLQLGGGTSGTLQLLNPIPMLQQVGNTVQLVQVPTSTAADTQGTASQPTQHVAKRKLDPVGAEGADGGGGRVRRVEDDDCIAYIETDIFDTEGASDGLCIVPDDPLQLDATPAPTPLAVVSRKPDQLGADCKPHSNRRKPKKPLMRVGEVIDLNSDEEDRTAAGSAVFAAGAQGPEVKAPCVTWAPQPVRDKAVDWEDQIPMEVITYANEQPGRPPPAQKGSVHGFGQIVSVHSESELYSAIESIQP